MKKVLQKRLDSKNKDRKEEKYSFRCSAAGLKQEICHEWEDCDLKFDTRLQNGCSIKIEESSSESSTTGSEAEIYYCGDCRRMFTTEQSYNCHNMMYHNNNKESPRLFSSKYETKDVAVELNGTSTGCKKTCNGFESSGFKHITKPKQKRLSSNYKKKSDPELSQPKKKEPRYSCRCCLQSFTFSELCNHSLQCRKERALHRSLAKKKPLPKSTKKIRKN